MNNLFRIKGAQNKFPLTKIVWFSCSRVLEAFYSLPPPIKLCFKIQISDLAEPLFGQTVECQDCNYQVNTSANSSSRIKLASIMPQSLMFWGWLFYLFRVFSCSSKSGIFRRQKLTLKFGFWFKQTHKKSCERKVLKSGNRCRHLWRAFVAALLVAEERTQFHLERLLLPIPKL